MISKRGGQLPAITESGKLPSGVTFAAGANGTATISGTPAAGTSGDYPITLTATSIVGSPAQQAFSLFVDQAPAITSASSATFTAGSAGSFTVTSTGYPSPAITESGALPGGVTLHSNGDGTATLSGTPSAGGSFPITISASNGVGSAATQSFTLTVSGGTPSPPTLPPTKTVTATPATRRQRSPRRGRCRPGSSSRPNPAAGH
jgi:large repetitive protein